MNIVSRSRKGYVIVGTIFVGGILVGIVALIIRYMLMEKKKGKSMVCGGDCKNCGGHCS